MTFKLYIDDLGGLQFCYILITQNKFPDLQLTQTSLNPKIIRMDNFQVHWAGFIISVSSTSCIDLFQSLLSWICYKDNQFNKNFNKLESQLFSQIIMFLQALAILQYLQQSVIPTSTTNGNIILALWILHQYWTLIPTECQFNNHFNSIQNITSNSGK